MIKKIFAVLLALALMLPLFGIAVTANDDFRKEVGAVDVNRATPDIDGIIKKDEGWGSATHIDKSNYSTAWTSMRTYEWNCDSYFAYDENGLYFALDINDDFELTDENFGADGVRTVGTVISDPDDDSYADADIASFNGDTFIITLDPLNYFINNSTPHTKQFTARYSVGITEDGAVLDRRIYDGDKESFVRYDISSSYVNGRLTENGWQFELFISFEDIASDCEILSDGQWIPDAEELGAASTGEIYDERGFADRKNGNTWYSADYIYVDRYIDEDSLETETWQRYCTVATYVNGYSGDSTDGISNACDGIYMKLTGEDARIIHFDDVAWGDWFYGDVYDAAYLGLYSGVSENLFAPGDEMTRGMFVAVLHRFAGNPEYEGDAAPFTDVKSGAYYEQAVNWAHGNSLLFGISETSFGPDLPVTREQIAVFLFRYADFLECKYKTADPEKTFSDFNTISGYAYKSVGAAVKYGILSGFPAEPLPQVRPLEHATRAQVAAMFIRFNNILPDILPRPIPGMLLSAGGEYLEIVPENSDSALEFAGLLNYYVLMWDMGGTHKATRRGTPLTPSKEVSGPLKCGDVCVDGKGNIVIVYADFTPAKGEYFTLLGHVTDSQKLADGLLGNGICYVGFIKKAT